MSNLFGNLPSVVKNPFTKSSIERISIVMYRNAFNWNDITYYAKIEFRNGNTKGEQEIKGIDLADVFIKTKEFCEQLED